MIACRCGSRLVVAALLMCVLAAAYASAPDSAAGAVFEPELGVPGTDVVAIGASPGEAPGEAWAYSQVEGRYALLKHVQNAGWLTLALPSGPEGSVLSPLAGAAPQLVGQATPAGGVVLMTSGGAVTRDPGGQPQLIPPPPPAEIGAKGNGVSTVYAAIDEPPADADSTGHTGVVIATACEAESTGSSTVSSSSTSTSTSTAVTATASSSSTTSTSSSSIANTSSTTSGEGLTVPCILHYNGSHWTRESIVLPSELQGGFTPKALACGPRSSSATTDSPLNCWLLAQYESPEPTKAVRLALFRRVPTNGAPGFMWVRQPVADQLLAAPSTAGGAIAALGAGAQQLTVTSAGVWVDFQAQIGGAPAPLDVSELVVAPALEGSYSLADTLTPASTLGAWCEPLSAVVPGCSSRSLGGALPANYRSFAWAGASSTDPGTRIITGLPGRGLLELSGGSFAIVAGPGNWGPTTAPGAAAFSLPDQGWIADGAESTVGFDHAGQAQVIEVDEQPSGQELQEESVPFRHPLLAVAQQPGTTPGNSSGEALAVGLEGQIARYTPGEGWHPEALYNSEGKIQTPNLRGVAWPEPGRAYAVGDGGTMWLWRAETGLWEPDPAKPFNLIGNLTAIAFSPTNPSLGYAVGKQGVMLKYGKSWEQVELPSELQHANFTSVAFAGGAVFATYHMTEGEHEVGGLAVQEGSGPWHIEKNISSLLFKVAGLPDGGAVAAGPGGVVERESEGTPWHASSEPLPEMQNAAAVAAYREPSGALRAVVSIDLDAYISPNFYGPPLFRQGPWAIDMPPPGSSPDQPPLFLESDPLPLTGYVLKETADGWVDLEHNAVPNTIGDPADAPYHPDPALALDVSPSGADGLAVGGQTGDFENGHPDKAYETGGAMRFPAASASADGSTPAPVAVMSGRASFVVAGQATCLTGLCEGPTTEHFGPVAWLEHALRSANEISGGLNGFLYTGSVGGVDVLGVARAHYRGGVPIYAAEACESGEHYCAYLTGSSGSRVKVIVLGFSVHNPAGPALESTEEAFLEQELETARSAEVPAIVVGIPSIGLNLPEQSSSGEAEPSGTSGGQVVQQASDASNVVSILLHGGASAYFFDYPGSNAQTTIEGLPVYGTGTLGYVGLGAQSEGSSYASDSLGSSGFLLAELETGGRSPRCPKSGPCNIAPVAVRVEPNIGQLALDATGGTLLRRSQVALFNGLARRPPGGVAVNVLTNGLQSLGPELYDQIPFNCQGPNCPYEVPTDYTFTSSEPDRGAFVVHEPGSSNPLQVELGPDKLPVSDEPRNSRGELNPGGRFSENSNHEPVNEKGEVVPRDQSGIFCAFNTTSNAKTGVNEPLSVSITTGGLTYSMPVTIQAGSVEYPCGTVPLKNPPAAESTQLSSFPSVPLPASNPPPANPQVQTLIPPPPPAVVAAAPVPHVARPHPPALVPFFPLAAPTIAALPAIVPPPGPPVPRPIPPSGTSPVYQSAVAPEDQREEETATSVVGLHQFSAYRADEHSGLGPGLLLLVLIAAGAGTGIYRGTRSSGRQRRLALARAESRSARRGR
jgi:hypothetical protein